MPQKLPPLYTLQAFVAAAQAGSLTGAAATLHLTQSAVSRQIQLLEGFFGCGLFVRQARGLALTPQGAQLLPVVQEVFGLLAQAVQTLSATPGVLTLQLPPTLASRWFLPRLPALREALPGLDLRLATLWSGPPDFGKPDVDACIAHGAGGWPGLVEVPLMRERLAPLCAPGLLPALREPGDLARQTLLHPDPARREWASWLAAAGVTGVDAARGPVFDTLDMALSAAARGQGVAIADPALLQESLAGGMLALPFPLQVESGLGYFFTYPAGRPERPGLRPLQAWLTAQFGPDRASTG